MTVLRRTEALRRPSEVPTLWLFLATIAIAFIVLLASLAFLTPMSSPPPPTQPPASPPPPSYHTWLDSGLAVELVNQTAEAQPGGPWILVTVTGVANPEPAFLPDILPSL